MLTKQFHDEAVRLVDNPRITATVFDIEETPDNVQEIAQPLLLRLLLNGWITDKEKVFLDSIVPQDCLTFVIHGTEYIHPEGLELFPFEEIETTILHGGEAIFSHRYRPKQMKDSHQEYRIFSAAVNPGEPEKIILGFFGPTHRLGTIDEDCGFSRLVETFRQTYTAIKSDLPMLRQYLARSRATILVSRSTGRVQALNRAALKLFARTDRAMVDISLDQLKYHLTPLLANYNLKMENISVADLGLSVVALEPNHGKSDVNREILLQLSNRINSAVAGISLASNRLQSISSLIEDDEKYRLSDTIKAEAEKLRLVERQFCLFTNYETSQYETQTIGTELQKAIRSIRETGKRVKVPTDSINSLPCTVTGPPDTCSVLFESILTGHLEHCRENREAEVLLEDLSSAGVRMYFMTPVVPDLSAEMIRGSYDIFARHIAGLLGMEINTDLDMENQTLITELTIKK